MKIWQIIKGMAEGKYSLGDKFIGIHPENSTYIIKLKIEHGKADCGLCWYGDVSSNKEDIPINTFTCKYDFKKIKRRED